MRIPRVLPRVIRLPDEVSDGQQAFVLLSSVIRAHLHELFAGREIKAFSQFRLTRDSDIEVDEDDVTDLRLALRSKMSTRQFGQAIRLEVVRSCPKDLSDFLLEQFDLSRHALFHVNGPVNLVRLSQLVDQVEGDHLRFAPYQPSWPEGLPQHGGMFDHLRRSDVMLHHPFESFDAVVQFLREAVYDPNVLAIKQTIYRTGSESVLMDLLLEAVRRGKEVLAVVELKAGSTKGQHQLGRTPGGAGRPGGVRHRGPEDPREDDAGHPPRGGRLRRYAHLSTGNYNPKTAKLYTDVGYLTSNPDITADIDNLFNQLSSMTQLKAARQLLLAPSICKRP